MKREPRQKHLLNYGWHVGLIAMLGGYLIFLIYFISRKYFAYDLEVLEFVGFIWMIVFFWFSIFSLLFLLVYVILNFKLLHWKVLFTLIILLINIPNVLLILAFQRGIEDKVYIKIMNKSGVNMVNARLTSNLINVDIGNLQNKKSKVFNYTPPFYNNDSRIYQKPDTLNLVFLNNNKIDTIGFPTLKMGVCGHILIDSSLKTIILNSE